MVLHFGTLQSCWLVICLLIYVPVRIAFSVETGKRPSISSVALETFVISVLEAQFKCTAIALLHDGKHFEHFSVAERISTMAYAYTSMYVLHSSPHVPPKMFYGEHVVEFTKRYSSSCAFALVLDTNISLVKTIVKFAIKIVYFPTTYFMFHFPIALEEKLLLLQDSITNQRLKYALAIIQSGNFVKLKSLCLRCADFSSNFGPGKVRNIRFESVLPKIGHDFHPPHITLSSLTSSSTAQVRIVNGIPEVFKTGGEYLRAAVTICETLNSSYNIIPQRTIGNKAQNGSYGPGIIQDLISGKAEIAISAGITHSRSLSIDFSAPILNLYVTFVHGPLSPVRRWTNVLRPLNKWVWIGLVIAVIKCSIILQTIVHLRRTKAGRIRLSLSKILQFLLASLILQVTNRQSDGPLRVFAPCWYLFVIVLTTAYSAKLYNIFTFPPLEPSPRTFTELAVSDFQIGFTYYGGLIFDYFSNARSGTAEQKISTRMEKMTLPECHKRALQGDEFACIAYNTESANYMQSRFGSAHRDGGLVTTGASTLSVYSALLLQKRSPLRNVVDSIILRMVAAGLGQKWNRLSNAELFDEIRQKGETKTVLPKKIHLKNQPKGLAFSDLSYLFTMVATMGLLALCVAALEVGGVLICVRGRNCKHRP